MAATIPEIERKIASDTLNKKFIKEPMIFSVEGYGKTSHLVLTNHVISLSEFSSECLELIYSCESYVTEESHEDYQEYYGNAILLSAKRKPWVNQLPPEVAKSLQSAIAKCFESFYPSARTELHELKIWAAFQFAREGYLSMLMNETSDPTNSENVINTDSDPVNQTNTQDSTTPSLSMDHELILNVFPNDTHGLENLLSKIPAYKKEANSIQNLIDLYNSFPQKENQNTPSQKSENIEDENSLAELLDKSLAERLDNYRNAAHLYNPKYASENNEDKPLIAQNLKWLLSFYRHHNALPNPLFGVGTLHGVGEWGLLSLLPRLGFIVKRLTPNNTFEPYIYPFQSTVASAHNASERLIKRWTRELDYDDYRARVLYQYKTSSNKKSKMVKASSQSTRTVQTGQASGNTDEVEKRIVQEKAASAAAARPN